MMNNYWSSRAVELEKLLQDKTNATIVEINKLYSDASKSIASKIAKLFETYKKGGQIDSAHALQLLTAHQTAEQRKELLELLSRTTDKKARREIISILDAPAYADRISRLQALQDLVKAEALQLGIAEEKLTTARLKDVAKASYYRTIYNDQKNIGKAYDFNKISSRQLKAMLAHKWSGSNYSARIWNNNDKFIDKLQRTIEVGCMAGLTLRELEDRIVDDCIGETSDEGQRFCASRLIRTEVNYFANQGMLMGYEEAGIKKYLFVATLDLKTSEICRKLDLKSFPVSEAEAGVNLPPMHPFCRSVTIPDTGSRSGTRWARNPITGKSMKVPADMTYQQWYDKYVLTKEEEYAIKQYIGSKSYRVNEKLRQKLPLTDEENQFIITLDSALNKMPKYEGHLSRSLIFDNDEDLNRFLADHQVGNTVTYREYLSTTFGEVYNPEGQVQIHFLNTVNGRDISKYNPDESEVLYQRGNNFKVIQVEKKDDITDIYMKEE